MCKCQRCNRELTTPESIKRGYGETCYRIVSNFKTNRKLGLKWRKLVNTIKYRKKKEVVQTPVKETLDAVVIKDILDRLRRVELDNSHLKARENHRTLVVLGGSKPVEEPIERIKREEAKKITDPALREIRMVFKEVVSELKGVLAIRKQQIEEAEEKAKNKIIDIQELKIVRE